MHKVELDSERCKGCLLCTTMCPKGLLKKGGGLNSIGFYTVTVEDADECTGCAMCAMICPDVAIEVWK
jgi:2-oxoglutarate ferredoxin oxidoreductase subunit delta